MYNLILMVHVFAAVLVILLVLLQQGKGATIGAAFGSGASQTVFGSRGSGSFLLKLTIGLVILFFITSLGLNYMVAKTFKQETVINLPATTQAQPQSSPLPAAPTIPPLPSQIPSN